jgi:hypothetical protein
VVASRFIQERGIDFCSVVQLFEDEFLRLYLLGRYCWRGFVKEVAKNRAQYSHSLYITDPVGKKVAKKIPSATSAIFKTLFKK